MLLHTTTLYLLFHHYYHFREGREFALPRDTEIFADIKPKDANNLRTNLVADAKERKIKAAAEEVEKQKKLNKA